ncbi:ATP adenylyltransferase [Halovenus aranensis]|uniref:ATP adenylyltransferase n=1 Tax=Halovenus aranensis TaxID=890420 RepID=A0A1G8RS50_9EURY|nr:HIT domain-containing protein [Halovenus aranensis]SDJ19788.1 ATP adenylyltransferase [Halovenus aranensis]
MEQVFAPWRIDWVERSDKNEMFEDCVFCELPDYEGDRENRLLARGDRVYVLLNNHPYNPGHAMVIPHQHTGRYRDLGPEVLLEIDRLLQRTLDAMDEAFSPDGYNVGYNLGGDAAGGSIDDHLHAHVVPRWTGDTNFMPVIGETNVIVEAVDDTYGRLHDALTAQNGTTASDDQSAVVINSQRE